MGGDLQGRPTLQEGAYNQSNRAELVTFATSEPSCALLLQQDRASLDSRSTIT